MTVKKKDQVSLKKINSEKYEPLTIYINLIKNDPYSVKL